MAIKDNRRVQLTKRILKETLIELMQEKEISQISIRELCEKADMNRSTFYMHYTDQFNLLESIEEEVIQNTLSQFHDAGSSVLSPKNIEIFLSYIHENGSLFRVLLCKKESSAFKDKLITEVASMLKGYLEFKVEPEMLPYVYSFLMEGCSGILVQWINSNFSLSEAEISKLIFSLCQSVRLAS